MNNKPPNRELDRVTYWEGQMLRSSDFLGIQRVEDQRRWWHNRAMHNAYGVYQGFQASAVDGNQGQPDVVQVNPGVAYDCFGRELILECRATIQYAAQPLAQGDVRTLLVRYKRPPSRRDSDPVTAVCCFCNGRHSSSTIEFVWTDNRRISPQDGVPLGKVGGASFNRGRFSGFRTPPRRRALARPHLATGSTVAGNTSWQPWDFTPPLTNVAAFFPTEIGVQTTIDTSAAGFTQIPQYFAWLQGSIWNPATVQLVPALLPSIANESLDSFTFRLILMVPESGVIFAEGFAGPVAEPINLIQSADDFADFAQQQGLYVAWLGSQMPAATPFVPTQQNPCQANYRAEYVRGTR